MRNFLALDLGASSGRGVLGTLGDDKSLTLREIHRFTNGPISRPDGVFWDLPHVLAEIEIAVSKAGEAAGNLESIGCDTWAVDHGFIDRSEKVLQLPYSYQDPRTQAVFDEHITDQNRREMFRRAGAAVRHISTLFQLVATGKNNPDLLANASKLLFIPDLVHFHLTGEAATEFTTATTTGLFSPATRGWDWGLIDRFGLPRSIFCTPVQAAGTRLGHLTTELRSKLKLGECAVVLPGCHDTASAVAAAPVERASDLVLSSGTWAMLGVIVDEPVVADEAADTGCGNYGLPDGSWCFMKGVMGLWLLERFKREERIDDLLSLLADAENEPPLRCLIDPANPCFQAGATFREILHDWCRATAQEVPRNDAAVARCILESLALFFRECVETLGRLTDRSIDRIVVVGGGARNRLLNQFTADATGCTVIAGHPEATAVGNILVQMVGCGAIKSVEEGRALLDRSEIRPHEKYEAIDQAPFSAAFDRLMSYRASYLA